MVRPIDAFCCGCPLRVGVVLLLFFNVLETVFELWSVTMNVILRQPTVGASAGLIAQCTTGIWCLIGIPFIAGGIWGVYKERVEYLQWYTYFTAFSYSVDIIFYINMLLNHDPCVEVPTILKKHGAAAGCGFLRLAATFGIVITMCLAIYFVFVVWSYCEELKCGGGGTGFDVFTTGANVKTPKDHSQPHFASYGEKLRSPYDGKSCSHDLNYGCYNVPGLGEPTSIFWGAYHETNYPPPKTFDYAGQGY